MAFTDTKITCSGMPALQKHKLILRGCDDTVHKLFIKIFASLEIRQRSKPAVQITLAKTTRNRETIVTALFPCICKGIRGNGRTIFDPVFYRISCNFRPVFVMGLIIFVSGMRQPIEAVELRTPLYMVVFRPREINIFEAFVFHLFIASYVKRDGVIRQIFYPSFVIRQSVNWGRRIKIGILMPLFQFCSISLKSYILITSFLE